MSKPQNIECFESAAAGILATLYESFPKPLVIVSDAMQADLVNRLLIAPECVWPQSKGSPGQNIVAASLAWLVEEGLVRTKSAVGARFAGVVLTAKGFRALNCPIVPESGDETHGERLIKFVGGHASQGIGSAIGSLIQASVTGAFG